MAGRSSSSRPHGHHHRRHRSETSAPATSRTGDAARVRRQADQEGPALRRSPAFPPRRQQPQHQHQHHQRCDSERGRQPRCGELVGGTAAGCAAVCCCLPCAMVEVVVLATVRAPAALCRRAVRARRRGGVRRSASAGQAGEIYELLVDEGGAVEAGEAAVARPAAVAPSEEAGELEKEVWARFQGAGFWRSPSQLSDQMS
ncbi:uncharacterized protein LOC121053949 [Oryza brachyantha]|uniref:uncharacterized protein LOC121053949 n=1 Tax=Oryza brachyantha TaxID=4533 RepID=UPI001ADA2E1A|nr:uncharacterized protein LOC121053949 [Oryza brachyantha]